jgi:hypothetical protein
MRQVLAVSCCVASITLAILYSFDSRLEWFGANRDLLLPAYYGRELKRGVTGTMTFVLMCEKEKAPQVRLARMNLRSTTDYVEKYPDLVEIAVKKVEDVIRGWPPARVGITYSEEITIEYKQDAAMAPENRRYEVVYGRHDIPVRVTITGPTKVLGALGDR